MLGPLRRRNAHAKHNSLPLPLSTTFLIPSLHCPFGTHCNSPEFKTSSDRTLQPQHLVASAAGHAPSSSVYVLKKPMDNETHYV
ncbi:hypothetical protein GCM10023333_03040 [Ferrimonas pelagia]|uniref:Uncharacterized protein n=1 Tax=Ferrimonas pelagia TaxID=1177826 RepID=A0ABP9EFT5_9GAMM